VPMRARHWTLFTNHAAVFIHLLEHPEATIRTIADELGLAERTVVGVLQDLRREDYLLVRREGRIESDKADRIRQIRRKISFKRSAVSTFGF